MLSAITLIVGLVLLVGGGALLVRGACEIATGLGVSPLIIGLTVVAFGTSCPELAASLTAALEGAPDIAVGNVFGSNVANLGLILGLSALIVPFTVTVAFLPWSWSAALLGFLWFRLFDISKPPPVSWFDRTMKNGVGVVLDDVMAGVYAAIALHLCLYLFG